MRYYLLKNDFRPHAERARVIDNLSALRAQLDRDVPDKDAEQNLLLATWNIRDLGKPNRRGFGKRSKESHFYIAEVISRFDFVAVQEVNELAEWERILRILGPDWSYIATDETDRALGGNGERLTFAFDKRKVWFQNVAGEIVLPRGMLISKVEGLAKDEEGKEREILEGKQFHRTPFFASFQSGWLKFDICTVHIYYGSASGAKLQERVEEIGTVAKYLGKRADKALKEEKATLLLGDFNVVRPDHETMEALLTEGFKVPKALSAPTNIDRSKFYDQIAFKTKPEVIEYVEKQSQDPKKRNAGVFEIFESVYRDDQFDEFAEAAKKSPNGSKQATEADLRKYYLTWRTYQFSDHKPLWVRLDTNDADGYLARLKERTARLDVAAGP